MALSSNLSLHRIYPPRRPTHVFTGTLYWHPMSLYLRKKWNIIWAIYIYRSIICMEETREHVSVHSQQVKCQMWSMNIRDTYSPPTVASSVDISRPWPIRQERIRTRRTASHTTGQVGNVHQSLPCTLWIPCLFVSTCILTMFNLNNQY